MTKIFYIDPQGGSGNLGMYDYELLSRIHNCKITFFGEYTYDYIPLKSVVCKFWFSYGKYSNKILKGLSYTMTMLHILLQCIIKRPKAIHIQWIRIPSFDVKYYQLIKKFLGVRLIYTVHNILPHNSSGCDRKAYEKMYRLCDNLIVHTRKSKQNLITEFKIDGDKIYVAAHGPLNYKLSKTQVDNEIRNISEKYGLNDKIVFSLLGYQSSYKGSDMLVEAWTSSPNLCDNQKIILLIAGKNADIFTRSHSCKNLITIDGYISDITFEALMNITDVMVLPYRKIDQSGVLLTLVSHRKPYCATNVGELCTPIQVADVGWIIPKVSAVSISSTLQKIALNSKEIETKSSKSKEWKKVENLYNWDESAKITQYLYLQLLNRGI